MDKQGAFDKIKDISQSVTEGGDRLESIINKTALSLDETLYFAFPINTTTLKIYESAIEGLDIAKRRSELEREIKDTTGTLIVQLESLETRLSRERGERDSVTVPNKDKDASGYESKTREKSEKNSKVEKTEQEINALKTKIEEKKKTYKALELFQGGLYGGATANRKKEIEEIKKANEYFNTTTESIPHETLDIGASLTTPINLDTQFKGTTAVRHDYTFYDEKQNKRIRLGDPLTVSATTASGNQVQITLKGVKIDPTSKKLSITDLKVEGDVTDAPLNIRDLYVRATYQHSSGRMFYNDKLLSLTINNPVANFNVGTAYDAVNAATGNNIHTQLDHTFDRKYTAFKKDVIFALLESKNKDQFGQLTTEQKDAFIASLVTTGYDMDKPAFQVAFKAAIVKEEFKGTETQFKKQLTENINVKAEEKLKKILQDRLDSTNIGGRQAELAILGAFTAYFVSVDINKDQVRRETLYNAVDVRTGGQITRQLAHVHGQKYKDTKKKVLLSLMEETIGKEAFDKLSDKQKDACLASLVTTGYDMDVPIFQTSFRTEIAKEDFTGTEEEFEKKLISNLDGKAEEQLQKILEKRLDSANIGGQKARSVLAGRFLDYVNNSAFDVPKRHAAFQVLEGTLTAELLQTRLRQEFELKFNKLQREAFEKTLALNPEFGKLNQAQKDRIYERIQELGTINAGVVDIKLGDQPTTPPTPLTYSIPEITFAPTLHQYSVMPSDEDYTGFSTWLVNQLPADVGSDPDKYRDWMRNGLVASLDNGKTHYENFFADVLKKFTDNINVKTTLNQTLLDFINDTNTADHMAFDADLLATLTSTTPLTDHPKKRYQKLMPWVKGEPQNYLSFFQGQSQEFKTESITAGGKTFGYSGKLEIGGAENVNMSIKMKDGQEQIYKSGSPVALVRALLTSTDLEPPHARFHAGLSVIKSVTKMARGNGISLRTALTPEMLDTLPISVRTTVGAGENPMVEIEEKDNGKLVATVFNLNLTTRRKENIHTMFDEEAFVATQSVRDLRQGVESLLALTNQTLNNTYANYREASRGSGLRKALLSKHRYGGLANFWKTISFEGETISVGGKTVTLTCKDGLFTFTGEGITKPISGRNLGSLLTFNPALRGIELKALHVANEKLIETYQEKLEKKDRMKNYGVIDEINHRVYILDKYGNLGYVENTSQDFASRWRQYNSGHSYGRIKDDDMPTGFRVMKKGKNIVDKETYNDFLRNEALVGPMVRAMSRTYRAVTTWAPWD